MYETPEQQKASWENAEIWAGAGDAQDSIISAPRRANAYYLQGWRKGAISPARAAQADQVSP